MGRVLLIGDPPDGQGVESPTSVAVLEVKGGRYVLRQPITPRSQEVRGWVAIFLPLLARSQRNR